MDNHVSPAAGRGRCAELKSELTRNVPSVADGASLAVTQISAERKGYGAHVLC